MVVGWHVTSTPSPESKYSWLTKEKCNQTKSIRKIRRMAYHLIPLSKCVNSERAVSISR